MNVNKDGQPETRVDKQSIFKDYGMYDFNKVKRQAIYLYSLRLMECIISTR